MDVAVRTVNLRKTYFSRGSRRVALVSGLTMSVPHGGVHGFLGPNGSGKTTTIRMLLGLVRADAGRMRIFGTTVPRALPEVIDRIGAIVEAPKFFPTFTGRRNLELLAGGIGVPRTAVDDVLERTAARDRAGEKYKGYSLGMKQRLAIAATLLKSPDLLIFDEPTNGLDPAGIHEIRGTMRRLADEGRAVLVSSHILAEVEQVADTVSIIGRGGLLAEGHVKDILGGAGVSQVRVGVASPDRAQQVLQADGFSLTRDGQHLLVGTDDPSAVTRALAGHGLYVSELVPVRPDLESAFLSLTADEGAWERCRPVGGRRQGRRHVMSGSLVSPDARPLTERRPKGTSFAGARGRRAAPPLVAPAHQGGAARRAGRARPGDVLDLPGHLAGKPRRAHRRVHPHGRADAPGAGER